VFATNSSRAGEKRGKQRFGCQPLCVTTSSLLCGVWAFKSELAGIRSGAPTRLSSKLTERTSKLYRSCCVTGQVESRWTSTLRRKCRQSEPHNKRSLRWSGRRQPNQWYKRALKCCPKCSSEKLRQTG
jgi:hypothetical protein